MMLYMLLSTEVSAQSLHRETLLTVLGANKALLLEQLQSENSFKEVQRLREHVKEAADWFCCETEDPTWSFVQELLLLLMTLTQHLKDELVRFQQIPPSSVAKHCSPEMAPPLLPDVLSVSQQKTLEAALQFVVSLGLCPYLVPGVGVPLGRRSAFGAMVEKGVCREVPPMVGRRLLTTTEVLLQVAELSSLETLVFNRHLGGVMAALCQLGYQPCHDNERVIIMLYLL